MATVQHSVIADPDIHEPKGVATATAGHVYTSDGGGSGNWSYPELEGTDSATEGQVAVSDGAGGTSWEEVVPVGADTATSGQVFVSDGAGSGTWETPPLAGTVSQGNYRYSDTATATTPISLTAGVEAQLTNDGLGTTTDVTHGLQGLTNMWDTTNNKLTLEDGSGVLQVGDSVDMQVQLTITTNTVNASFELILRLDPDVSPIDIAIAEQSVYKTAGTYLFDRGITFFVSTTAVLNGDAKLFAVSDTTGTEIEVRGFYIRALHTNT